MTSDRFIEWLATGLMLLAVVATFAISSAMLTNWKIHYVTAGGNFYEKLHPTTYFAFLAFALLLMRSHGPVGEINRMFSEAKLAARLSRVLAFPAGPDVRARAAVHGDHRHLPAAGRVVPGDLAARRRRKEDRWSGAVHLTVLLNVCSAITSIFPATG